MEINKDSKQPINTKVEEGVSQANSSSTAFLKLFTIICLIVIFLISLSVIQLKIERKRFHSQEEIEKLNDKWAGVQQFNGPVLSLPVIYEDKTNEESSEIIKIIKVLPENLKIIGKIDSHQLRKGIYESEVYQSDFKVSGNFDLKGNIDVVNLKSIDYDNAYLTIGINELRGIKNQIKVKVNQKTLEAEVGTNVPELIPNGIITKLKGVENTEKLIFSYELSLNGSEEVEFVPLGEHTIVRMESNFGTPEFKGKFLPDHSDLGEEGFVAQWEVLPLNKNLPSSWEEGQIKQQFRNATFGVSLMLPENNFQKSAESAKSAMLILIVIFLFFILVEFLAKRRIHPVQYILVGTVLCLFHILLISIGEHLNFPYAYGISSLVVISLISLYSLVMFKQLKLSILLLFVLTGLFGFLFISIQIANVALLLAGFGILLILAIIMYVSRNMNWYKLNLEPKK